MPAIAAGAGVWTGLIYQYFSSKAELFDEVFQRASKREIDVCEAAAASPGTARERLARVVEAFARRALRGRRLAWARLVESVDPVIDADHQCFRAPYRDIFISILTDAEATGELPAQNAEVAATAIVGAIAETLAGPLARVPRPAEEDALIHALIQFCIQAVGFRSASARLPDGNTPGEKPSGGQHGSR